MQALPVCGKYQIRYLHSCTFSTPWKSLPKLFLLDLWSIIQRKSTLKRHNSTVKHLQEEKKMRLVTEDLEQTATTTLWSSTPPEVRHLTYFDNIHLESCASMPTCKYFKPPPNPLQKKSILIPIEKSTELQDPRAGHGIYSQKPRPISKEEAVTYADLDTPDIPPIIIENEDKSLSYTLVKVANELVDNLVKLKDQCDRENTPI